MGRSVSSSCNAGIALMLTSIQLSHGARSSKLVRTLRMRLAKARMLLRSGTGMRERLLGTCDDAILWL